MGFNSSDHFPSLYVLIKISMITVVTIPSVGDEDTVCVCVCIFVMAIVVWTCFV